MVSKRLSQVDGRLAAELNDRAGGLVVELLVVQDLAQRLLVQGLEVEAVGGVEVGRYRLRVGVGDQRFVARLLQRPHCVHCRVVELDALADTDRPGADDQH